MKKINSIFWIIATLIVLQCMFFWLRGLMAIGYSEGTALWMWIFKILTYLGIAAIGILIYRIKNTFETKGFFTEKNVKQLRSLGIVAFITTLFNSTANACIQIIASKQVPANYGKTHELFYSALTEQVLDQSLISYILIFSIILLTYFTQSALRVKGENEAFI